MLGVAPVPCPVRLGSIRTGGVSAQAHLFTRERNLQRLEKLLKQGVAVDCVNNLGQTCLYCACLLGFAAVAELLLRYGADPNQRCDDRSTPVHAAVFSCDTRLLSKLLEAGGDLRLHDDRGRTPRDWAEIGAQKNSVKMVGFIKSCISVMRSLCEPQSPRERRITPTSPERLLHSPSLLDFLKPVSDMVLNKKVTSKSCVSDTVQCFGFGKVCVQKPGVSAGALAAVPVISDSELLQAEDETLNSFPCGSFTKMTNYSWRGSRVTVKELQVADTHRHAERHAERRAYLDLLITELSFCCQLFHPHLLQLMAVSSSNDLLQNRLVYERVHVGSLYTLFYHQRADFPLLQVDDVLSLILQVCEALFFLHSRCLVLRSLSSHSVLIVHPGVAKITGLGFMVSSECSPSSTLPVPVMLYNWAAPEVIRRKSCTEKADLYSMCALIQEFYTDAVPWGSVNPSWIKQAVDAGQALSADLSVPQPYYDLLLNGLKPRAQERTCSLQDLRYTLRSDLRELRERRDEVRPLPARSSPHRWSPEIRQYRNTEHPDEEQVVENIQDQLQELNSVQIKPKRLISHLQNSDTDERFLDISFRDILPNHEWCLSPHTASVEEEDLEEEKEVKDRATESSTSNHINSIILNLKVSQVLLQQVESSLELTESRMMGNTHADVPHFDEPDGMNGRREKQVVVLEAVGPPSRYSPPSRYFEELEEDITEFCSAEGESFEFSEDDEYSSEGDGRTRGGECDSLHQSSVTSTSQEQIHHHHHHHHAEHHWTGVVSAAVTRITRRFLNCAAGKLIRSSDGEEVQEEQPLMDAQEEDTHLEQLFKSFAGVHSEREQSPDFHTINHTFTRPTTRQEVKGQHLEDNDSDSDYAHSPVEPSSIFYTPQHHLENTDMKEEPSRTVSLEDDPDVTLEVCRPNMTTETSSFRECRSSPDEPQHTDAESVPASVHTTSHLADIADLSSITCSPAQLQERVGQNGACPSPRSTYLPACNSTPRSPLTLLGQDHSATHKKAHVCPLVPPLQSLMETSLWGSAESLSHTETHDKSRRKRTDPIHSPKILQSPTERSFPHGDSDTPCSGNPEFTTASSGVRNCEAEKSQEHSDPAEADVLIVEKAAWKKRLDSEQGGVELPEEQEEQRPHPNQTVCYAASSAEETERAHASLDEVLLVLLENPEAHGTPRGAIVTTGVIEESLEDVGETCGRSACAERESREQPQEKDKREEEEVMESSRSRDTSEDAGATYTLASGDQNSVWEKHTTPSGSDRTEGFFWSTYPPKQGRTPTGRLCSTLPSKLH